MSSMIMYNAYQISSRRQKLLRPFKLKGWSPGFWSSRSQNLELQSAYRFGLRSDVLTQPNDIITHSLQCSLRQTQICGHEILIELDNEPGEQIFDQVQLSKRNFEQPNLIQANYLQLNLKSITYHKIKAIWTKVWITN